MAPKKGSIRKKWTLLDLQQYAASKGGLCLSDAFLTLHSKYSFSCSQNHKWQATANATLKQGQWCNKCWLSRHSMDWNLFRKIVFEKGGKVISGSMVNGNVFHQIQCSKGHVWPQKPYNIVSGKWCKKCVDEIKATPLKDILKIVATRHGKVVSQQGLKKFSVECEVGHTWQTESKIIKNGHWCPYCKNKTEQMVRACFEYIFRTTFSMVRPSWLRSKTGYPLQLDGYCDSLKIAFEYDGGQHTRIISNFKMSESDLVKNQIRDEEKTNLCKKLEVVLIRIREISSPDPKKVLSEVINSISKNQNSLKVAIEIWSSLDAITVNDDLISKMYESRNTKDALARLMRPCLKCSKPIMRSAQDAKFCSSSCSSSFNNRFKTGKRQNRKIKNLSSQLNLFS